MKPPSSSGIDRRHWLLVLLVALSGATALGHQLLWTRRLTDLLGASSESSVRVFGCFFLGLGSAAAAWKGGRFARPFRTLVWIELGIIALTLPILTLPAWTDWIWPALGPGALTDWRGSAVKLIVSFLVVTPPAILMGAGFPLLIRGALNDGRTMHRHGVDMYAGNTLGGVAGLLLAAVWIIPAAGSFGAIISCMGANAALAGAFWALDRKVSPRAEKTVAGGRSQKQAGAGNPIAYRTILSLSFFSGAGVLAAEVAGLKMLMLAATFSFHTPMAILCAVILTLGISACCVRPALRLAGSAASGLPVFASLAGALLCVAPLIFMAMVTRENPFVGHASLWSFSLQLILVALASLGPALLFGGMIFPAALHWLGAEGDDARGHRLGWLMALNGLGGLIGAELAHGVLIPTLGVYRTFGCIGLAYVAVSAALSFRRGRRGVVAGKTATALAAAVSVLLLGNSDPCRM
jgi:spermidine synthase